MAQTQILPGTTRIKTMSRTGLNSTSLAAAGYLDRQALLELEFRSGAVYRYFGVPAETYEALLRAQSKGGLLQSLHSESLRLRQDPSRSTADSCPRVNFMPESVTFCGRTFTACEMELMRCISSEYSALGVTEIARTVCELLDWRRLGGGLKNHECRQLLERLASAGLLKLPDLRQMGGRGPRRADISRPCIEPEPVECAARECEPLELVMVEGKRESRLWREQVERYHYLGCRVPFGAHLRYLARNRDRELACLLWMFTCLEDASAGRLDRLE